MTDRQRSSEFVDLSDDAVLARIKDPTTPMETRGRLIREAKARGLRNVQKRLGRHRSRKPNR